MPLFPLPGVFLFPHQVVPLHIFEERYRTMVADLLDGPGRLVLAAPQLGASAASHGSDVKSPADGGPAVSGHAPGSVPDVVPVAGLGEILRHEKLDDGRYMIWVLGLSRVHIHEVPSDRSYRLVECLPFVETAVPEFEAEDLARELRDAATNRLQQELPLPDSTPPGLLADLLMQTLQASRTLLERAFVEPDVAARARLALREAERAPPLLKEDEGDSEDGDSGGGAVRFDPPGADIPDGWGELSGDDGQQDDGQQGDGKPDDSDDSKPDDGPGQ